MHIFSVRERETDVTLLRRKCVFNRSYSGPILGQDKRSFRVNYGFSSFTGHAQNETLSDQSSITKRLFNSIANRLHRF
jgi:hypothetical protein